VGQYDGTLPDGGESDSERKIWRLYGHYHYVIVIPIFLQTITFGYILKNFLNNNPGNAIWLECFIASHSLPLLKTKKPVETSSCLQLTGH
jgi:hypothetical protein